MYVGVLLLVVDFVGGEVSSSLQGDESEMKQEDGRELMNNYVMLCVAQLFLPYWVSVPQQGFFFPMWGFSLRCVVGTLL